MRRLALILAALAILLAGCGGSHSTRPHFWLTPGHGHKLSACVSSDCGQWSATLNWVIPSFPNTTGYDMFLNGTQIGTATSSPFTFYGSDCAATNTLGVRAHDGSGNHGPLWTTSYTAPACPGGGGGGLPTGVTLQPVDGGSCTTSTGPCSDNYYCANGFTNACNAGWDSLSYFPIMQDYYYCSQSAATWAGVGLNSAIRFNSDCSPSTFGTTMTSNHFTVIPGDSNYTTDGGGTTSTGFGSETVGWHVEEPSTWSGITSDVTTKSGYSTGGLTGRFLQLSLTPNSFPNSGAYPGVSGIPAGCGPSTPNTVMTCTSGMPSGRHIDVISDDSYWFAGSASGAPNYNIFCDWLYGGSPCTTDQIGRGSNYGDMVDLMRSWTSAPHYPAAAYIESCDGNNSTPARAITPAEINWAVWDTIVHGARYIPYFTSNSHAIAACNSMSGNAGFPTTVVGGTTAKAQATATDGLVESLAPIINSPFALSFASDNAGGYVFPTQHLVLDNGLDISTHYYTNGSFSTTAGTFGNGLYIIASIRGSEAQTMPKTVTFTLPSTDTTPSGTVQDVCACSPTQSTGTVSYSSGTHQFSETFNAVTDTHIIGPFQ